MSELPKPCTLADMKTKYEAGKVYRVTGECIIETLQLIESLSKPPADTATGKCPICDWPLRNTTSEGCIAGNCSYRPHEGTPEYFRIRERRRQLVQPPADTREPRRAPVPAPMGMRIAPEDPDCEYVFALGDMGAVRAELSCVVSNLAEVLFPDSTKESAEAEFALDAMGACQAIRRMRARIKELESVKIRCARCGSSLLPSGQCSRIKVGCQGGWGESRATNPTVKESLSVQTVPAEPVREFRIADMDSETRKVIYLANVVTKFEATPERMNKLRAAVEAFQEKHADERAQNLITAIFGDADTSAAEGTK